MLELVPPKAPSSPRRLLLEGGPKLERRDRTAHEFTSQEDTCIRRKTSEQARTGSKEEEVSRCSGSEHREQYIDREQEEDAKGPVDLCFHP